MQPLSHPAAFARIGRKVQPQLGEALPWGAPPIPDLIKRIDAALKQRGRA